MSILLGFNIKPMPVTANYNSHSTSSLSVLSESNLSSCGSVFHRCLSVIKTNWCHLDMLHFQKQLHGVNSQDLYSVIRILIKLPLVSYFTVSQCEVSNQVGSAADPGETLTVKYTHPPDRSSRDESHVLLQWGTLSTPSGCRWWNWHISPPLMPPPPLLLLF